MITLYQLPPAWGIPNISPYCVKLEAYLRMAGIPYDTKNSNIRQAPKGRVPYVKIDGKLVGDSSIIIEQLKRKYGDSLDRNLSAEQRGLGLAIQRLLEDHLYFSMAWLRWGRDDSFAHVAEHFKKTVLPPILGGPIMKLIRKGFLKDLVNQGVGDHSEEEIIASSNADLSALSAILGEKPYFLGAEPSSVDAIAYGFLIQILWVPWDGPVKQHLLGLTNLVKFCENFKQRYWS